MVFVNGLNPVTADRLYTSCTVTKKSKYTSSKSGATESSQPEKANMLRNQFLEAIVKIAQGKYIDVPLREMKLSGESMS